MEGKIYHDSFICPRCGGTRKIWRRTSSAGKVVPSWCSHCNRMVKVKAGVSQ